MNKGTGIVVGVLGLVFVAFQISISDDFLRLIGVERPETPTLHGQSELREAPMKSSQLAQGVQGFELDRTAIIFAFGNNRNSVPHIFIGFRNASDRSLEYRFNHVYLTIDGVHVRTLASRTPWIQLPATQDFGYDFVLENTGIVIQRGTVLTVTYQIEIRDFARPLIETRYQSVRRVVLSAVPLRMSEDQEVLSRSTFMSRIERDLMQEAQGNNTESP